MPDRYEMASLLLIGLAIFCAISLLALVCWDREPRKEPLRPTVPMDQRLPPV